MSSTANEHAATGGTILLIDDDPGDQELTRRAFEDGRVRNPLRVVSDGEEAMEYLLRERRYADPSSAPRPDLVLLDLNLPKVDGKEVLRRMKAHADLRRIPVVVLTTSRQEADILRTYELGVSSFITKPLDMDEFVEVVRMLGKYWFQIVMLPSSE